jgi:hypothetical protein
MTAVFNTLFAENRARLVAELTPRLRDYESRYELASTDLEAALADGRIRDTEDICDWVIAWETLRALKGDPAPLD